MNLVVIDASYAGAWLLPDELTTTAEADLQNILSGELDMVVPALWHYEMCNLLASAIKRQRISEEDASKALSLLHKIPMQVYDHHDELWQRRLMILGNRFGLSSYDAAYLELADRLQCPLRTHDGKLKSACSNLGLSA